MNRQYILARLPVGLPTTEVVVLYGQEDPIPGWSLKTGGVR
jgi:hypothetical protein